MRWSIRYQLLVPLLTLLLGVVGMSTWTALASAHRAQLQIETQVRDIVRTVNRSTFPLTEKVLDLMKGFSGADFVLVEKEGQRVTTLPSAPADLPTGIAGADDWPTLGLGPRVIVDKTPFLCSGIRLGHWPNEGSHLYIFYPESLWRDALWEAIRPSLILGVVGGLASLVLTVLVAQRLGRRIQEMDRRTRLIAAGDFSPMPLPRRNDELRDLGRSVNDMAQRLAQFQETVKNTERLRLLGQVGGGLAHQLRNGVTGARLAVQLHARECNGQADPEPLTVALRQLALVEMHLKRFLDLGRPGEGIRRPCSLAAILNEAVALVRPQCRHTHIDLRWPSPDITIGNLGNITVQGDASQLGQMMLNILTNALEAAGPGGWVQVNIHKESTAIVAVSDSGPGPPPEVAQRLFEPFVTGKPEGVGLGLAVARQVAEAHGGTIRWQRETDRTIFQIELPFERDQAQTAGGAS